MEKTRGKALDISTLSFTKSVPLIDISGRVLESAIPEKIFWVVLNATIRDTYRSVMLAQLFFRIIKSSNSVVQNQN